MPDESSHDAGYPVPLRSGGEVRTTHDGSRLTAVLVNGGQARETAGTWSATLEWLVRRLAPRLPGLGFVEVRYRVKSWRQLDSCAEDALDAVDLAAEHGAARCALVGFSMGGAVAVKVAADPRVTSVVGLAPWLPDRLDLAPLVGRRFAVVHGGWDRSLPGVPGVDPRASRRGYERARELGVLDAGYTLISGGVHGVAVHTPLGLLQLPRAGRWADLLEQELRRFQRQG